MEVTESHYAGLLERYALVLQELQASLKVRVGDRRRRKG